MQKQTSKNLHKKPFLPSVFQWEVSNSFSAVITGKHFQGKKITPKGCQTSHGGTRPGLFGVSHQTP